MKYTKIIFLDEENTALGPLAEALLKEMLKKNGITGISVRSRGNVVLFPEPINPKIAEIAGNNGLNLSGHMALQMENGDFADSTLVLTLDNDSKQKAYSKYAGAVNVFGIREFLGENGDIKFQMGKSVGEYADVYSLLDRTIGSLVEKITSPA